MCATVSVSCARSCGFVAMLLSESVATASESAVRFERSEQCIDAAAIAANRLIQLSREIDDAGARGVQRMCSVSVSVETATRELLHRAVGRRRQRVGVVDRRLQLIQQLRLAPFEFG